MKEKEIKELISNEYKRRLKFVLKTNLNGRSKILAGPLQLYNTVLL